MRPIEQVRAYLAELVGGPDTPWQERRAQSAKFADAFVTPPNVRIEAGSLGGIACEWVRADGAPGSPVFLHFHGGGYVMGSPALSRALTTQLALSGKMSVVSVDYRLAPEAPFPAALDDAVAAYGALLETTPAANILVGGESAGGGLAVAMLVNNAGVCIAMPLLDMPLQTWRRQMAVNLDGVFLGTKAALPLIAAAGGGSIVNVSSVAGLKGIAGLSGYCATKGGVRLFTKAVALECAQAKNGVRVNSIHPGAIETPIWIKMGNSGDLPPADDRRNVDLMAQARAASVAATPLGFPGAPSDIAAAVVYLACEESRFVTGAEFVIDGGVMAG